MTTPSRTTRRVALRDRRWIPGESIRVIGPIDAITAPRLRHTLAVLHRAAPRSPIVSRLDRAAGRWVDLTPEEFSRNADALVLGVHEHGATDATSVVQQLIDAPLHDRPALLAAGAGFAGMKISHAVGDGTVFNTIFPELLRAAAAARVPHIAMTSVRMPLMRAAARHYGRDPLRLASIVNTPRPVLPAGSTSAPMRLWQPAWAHRAACSERTTVRRVRDWRDRRAPGVSVASVLFAAVFSAFRRCGFGTAMPGLMVPVDARRYLPAGMVLGGNFAAGQYIAPADPANPQAVQVALDQAIRSGRPLTTLALRNLYSMLGRDSTSQPTQVSVQPQPQLTLTHLGRLTGYSDLPWTGGAEARQFLTAQRPGEPENVTVSIAEMDGALHVSASFHDTTFTPTEVARALTLFCEDPIALMADPTPH
jgi:hypothetical protein